MFTSHNNHLIHDDDHRINIMSTLLNMIHHLLRHDSASWGWTVAKENSSKLFSISCRLCQHFHLYILCIINPCNCHHSFSLHQGRSSWCVLQLGQSFMASHMIMIIFTLLLMIYYLLRPNSGSWASTVAKGKSNKLAACFWSVADCVLLALNPCNCYHSLLLHQGRSSWCVLQLGQSFVASRGPFGRSRITSRKTWRLYHHDQNCIVGHKKNTT